MSEKPKCPGCGDDMELMHLCKAAFCYSCLKCGWGSPVGIDSESAFRMAMRRAGPKNRVLTLEEVDAHCEGGADAAPLWYDEKERNVSRWMVIDLPELAFGSTATVKRLVNSQFFEQTYGEKWRCWLRKPTETERRGTPWAGDSRE